MRRTLTATLLACLALAGCGGSTQLITDTVPVVGVQSKTPQAGQKLGFPAVATKNTTRVAGGDPIADAAGVALAVYPSSAPGTHPAAVTIAPTADWQAAVAAAALMAAPIKAPILLSGSSKLPSATADALKALAPTGSGAAGGAQVIRVGDVPRPNGLRAASVSGSDPYTLAAELDRFASAARGNPSANVVVAPADNAQYAMPAAGWAAESGDPVLFVNHSGVPQPTRQALLSQQQAHIYVLGPASVIPGNVLRELGKYGSVKRVSGAGPGRQLGCLRQVQGSTVRVRPAVRSRPGKLRLGDAQPRPRIVLLNAGRPLDAAAAAPLSGSGRLWSGAADRQSRYAPPSVLNYFLDYATPGYTQEGPTAAVYNHGWVIGDQRAISVSVQAELDRLLEVVAPEMSQAENPDRLRAGHEVTVDDVRQLMGASTPHFALQLRERIRR